MAASPGDGDGEASDCVRPNTDEVRGAYANSSNSQPQQQDFPIAGSLRYESGFETDDSSEPCDIIPPSCRVGKIKALAMLLNQDVSTGRVGLTTNTCKVEFTGTESGEKKTERGRRGASDFVIKLKCPLWHHAEKAIVVARTEAGAVLGHGEFTFLPEKNKGDPKQTSVSIHLSMSPDETSRRFQNAIQRGADHRVLSGTETPLSGQTGDTCTATVYLAYGEPAIQKFIERLIVFAANVGLPQGVSLFELISPIPNFRDALVSCSFSDGSLQSVADYVYKQKQSSETVREEITKLIKLVIPTFRN
jgi:hypothetical protein